MFLVASALQQPVHAESSKLENGVDSSLVVGIFPRRNATRTTTLFKPMTDYLAEQLNRPVELVTAKDFPTFWSDVEAKRFDLVHFNQYHYVKAHKQFGYEAILRNEEFGDHEISGAIYVRADSGINRVSDLKGKRMVFGGGQSAMMSYIIPRDLLHRAGLSTEDYQADFAVSPPNSVFSVYFRQSDAAGAGEVVRRLPVVLKRVDPTQLKLIAVSDPVPQLPWAVKDTMNSRTRQQLVELLTSLKETSEGKNLLKQAKLTGLRLTVDADYQRPREIIQRVLNEQY